MGERNERLIAARKAAGNRSALAAAKRHGWPPSTYASHENGQTPDLPREAAQRYAKAFKVSADWLRGADVEMRPGGRARFLELFESLPPERQPEVMAFLEFQHERRTSGASRPSAPRQRAKT